MAYGILTHGSLLGERCLIPLTVEGIPPRIDLLALLRDLDPEGSILWSSSQVTFSGPTDVTAVGGRRRLQRSEARTDHTP
jgi:hypothetical protein